VIRIKWQQNTASGARLTQMATFWTFSSTRRNAKGGEAITEASLIA